jgi:hypothetical protein
MVRIFDKLKLFGNTEAKIFDRIIEMESLVSQVLGRILLDKYEFDKKFIQRYNCIFIVAKQLGMEIKTLTKKEYIEFIKEYKDKIKMALEFYEQNDIWIFPQFISAEKSLVCSGFVFRVLEKYSKFDFENNVMFSGDSELDYTEEFFEFVENLIKNKIFLEVSKRDYKIGDIVVYSSDDSRIEHIGFIYTNNMEILSKNGHSFLYIAPINSFFPIKNNKFRVLRINDEKYYENFKNNFMPVIEKMKLNKKELLDYVEKIINL